ncbi:MAG: molybdopterin-dependent oxidoreductase [Haloferacaceae archaeon]
MSQPRATVGRWTAGALAWVLGMIVARPLLGSDPTLVVAQTVIETSPGWFTTWAIDTFGKLAQPLLVATVGLGIVVAGALGGWLRSSLEHAPETTRQLSIAAGIGVVALTAGGFYLAADGLSLWWVLASGLALAPPGVVWLLASGTDRPVGRRRALEHMGAGAGAVLAGGAIARVLGTQETGGAGPGSDLDAVGTDAENGGSTDEKRDGGTTTPATTPSGPEPTTGRRETDGVVVSVAETDDAFDFGFEGMPAAVGGIEEHYVVDKNVSTVEVNSDDWSLAIEGEVEERRSFSLEDLEDHPDAREQTVTMSCISNEVGGDLISTTTWVGVPLRSLLEEAGVKESTFDVVTHAEDGYTEALPWDVIRDREDILMAVGMDGQTLPRDHGFPARLLIPGRYGMKSTKWVTKVEPTERDHTSYWERRGWDEEAVVGTFSYIRAVQRRGDRVAVGGIAHAGIRGIDRVEVSVDGGESWVDATLEDPPSPDAWRRWRHEVDRPDTGPIDVQTRATDGEGTRQPNEEYNADPDGHWHSVTVSL